MGIEIDFSLPAERVVRALNQIIEWRGKPLAIRVDNGPEYVSSTLMTWAEKQGIALTYIQPGKPQQNAHVERYNRTVRHEWLDLYILETVEEVQQIATGWLWTALLHKASDVRGPPFPRRIHPTVSVTGMPSAV